MEIAIYSGSFDPIHTGHAIVAQYVAQYCPSVDEVWLMVSRLNPLKVEGPRPMPDRLRLLMADTVAKRCSGVRVSDFELHLPYPSYSYFTLSKLKEEFPQHNFKIVIGSDNWLEFNKWRNPEEIIREFGLIIYPRPGYDIDANNLPPNVVYLSEAPKIEMSSTFIREAIAEGKNVDFFVPTEVLEILKEYGTGKR